MRVGILILLCLSLSACANWGKKQKGETAVGAAAGAAIGGALGNVIGKRMDQQAKELDKVADTERTENGIVTKLKGDVLFDTGAAVIKPEAADRLGKLADIIKKYPEDKITVVGHTDNTGSNGLNQNLSESRAQAVRVLMLDKGVPADSIAIVGLGEAQPVADNDSADGRALNRRVEMKISADPNKLRQ